MAVDTAAATAKLHRILLSWDYWELVRKSEEGGGPFDNLRSVPDNFKDMKEYKEVFEPLLLEECCAQILRGVEEGEVLTPHPCAVAASDSDEEDNDGRSSVGRQVSALGFCEGREGEQSVRVKFLLTDESQLSSPSSLSRVRAVRHGLGSPNSTWWLLKLSNMSTITREWCAMQNAECSPFVDILLSGKPRSAPSSKHMDIPPGMNATMEAQCNPSQMEALRAGLDGTPLVLIQGPPGTGKTRTILNLLSVVMHSAQKGSLELMRHGPNGEEAGARQQRYAAQCLPLEERQQLWHAQAPWAAGQPNPRDLVTPYHEGPLASSKAGNNCWGLLQPQRIARVGRDSAAKAHLLVCAPSNSALDEIVFRILKTGLMDKDGNIRMERDRMRMVILDEANIVCSTLSFAGSSAFSRLSRKFDVVVIDEAAQAVEPATLVPIINGCKQLYLVGDPVQLPATVISTRAQDHKYDMSLFKRLQNGGYPVKMLNTQYRMHPDISFFPSQQFYGGGLLDGQEHTKQPWHSQPCFGPLAFYDVAGKESVPLNGASIENKAEANMVLCVYREMVHRNPSLRKNASVAVISPYKAQVKLLREAFKTALGEEMARLVDVNTIDGFQGREKDVCFFSCVRALRKGRKGGGIGFVADERRINVGLTRARCSLIVIGNARALQYNQNWASLIHHTMTNGRFFRPKAPYADWMTLAASGGCPPVTPTEQELDTLNKVKNCMRGGKGNCMREGGGGVAVRRQ
ncbi:P-loop containing nucleoside triphosphate hydrolase protein [Dunaliella salina]|uniref:P-loop containing nucleoside triphosphate hydrolase protein n=1 Tax=Dunaliella salina TaxID=3046 RepID=A0ABQ7GM61_DUNSA|nr:P-loop containing nucleoside triphosphate hydrolase protein [Dunaliella salina]|eukprot:KAF5835699.1 P-loop containing nucleoside triphosphate hydrolase protein [Dunaliella salina]